MGLSGDTAALQRWQQRINRMVGVPQRVAMIVAPLFQEQLQAGFGSKTDPYGGGWKDIKPKTYARGTQSILYRSGALMGSIGAVPSGPKVRLIFGMPYAKFYITTGRGILPQAGRVPDGWKVTIRSETSKAFNELVSGGG